MKIPRSLCKCSQTHTPLCSLTIDPIGCKPDGCHLLLGIIFEYREGDDLAKRTSIEERQLFYRAHLAGKSDPRIATETGYSQACVRYWCRRQRDGGKIETKYQRPRQALLSRFDPRVRYAILRLRLKHPRWGPNRIVFHLRKRASVRHLRLPSETQIGRYLHQWERFRRKTRPELQRPRPQQPTEVHQRWQLDFKMGIALESGELVNLHTVCDPVGEACLGAQVFPAGRVGRGPHKITFAQAQGPLRKCFAHWKTLPQEIQTDGETDLVAERRTNDFPKPFTLWLKGLGIAHLVIRPGRPTDQAEVERCHRTINDYAIIGNESADLRTLQAILNQAVVELARELPSQAPGCSGQPPGQAHPELLQPGLTFSPEWEWAVFDLQNVDQHLAALCWTREVNQSGQVKIAAKRYYIGRIYAGQEVEVRFDPSDRHFVFSNLQPPNVELKRQPIKGLTKADLMGLDHPQASLPPQQLPLPLADFSFVMGSIVKEQSGV